MSIQQEKQTAIEALAKKFLQEAVFASREQSHGFTQKSADGGQCGLGARPAIPQEFNAKQARLLQDMLSAAQQELSEAMVSALREETAAWIKLQDGLDRKRNHFLKDFRNQHGFDRRAYPPEVEALFAQGVAAVNQENQEHLETHARGLATLFTR